MEFFEINSPCEIEILMIIFNIFRLNKLIKLVLVRRLLQFQPRQQQQDLQHQILRLDFMHLIPIRLLMVYNFIPILLVNETWMYIKIKNKIVGNSSTSAAYGLNYSSSIIGSASIYAPQTSTYETTHKQKTVSSVSIWLKFRHKH